MQTAKIVVLFLSFFTIGVASHRLLLQDETGLPARTLESGKLFEGAEAQQRILSELEQVHQLRERMLQAGKTALHPYSPWAMSVCNTLPISCSRSRAYQNTTRLSRAKPIMLYCCWLKDTTDVELAHCCFVQIVQDHHGFYLCSQHVHTLWISPSSSSSLLLPSLLRVPA